MKKYQTTFKIDKNTKIIVKLTSPVKNLDYGSWATVYLQCAGKKNIKSDDDTALEILRSLFKIITRVRKEKKSKYGSVKEDIGLIWNEIFYKKRLDFPYVIVEKLKYWSGLNYYVWSNPQNHTTWLFKTNNKIYLEVTPDYPWASTKPKLKDNLYTFDEFIKNYKPITMLEIELKIVNVWHKKVEKILADMKYNDDTLREAYYKNLQQQNS